MRAGKVDTSAKFGIFQANISALSDRLFCGSILERNKKKTKKQILTAIVA